MVETIPLREHLAAIREADLRFLEERDRRLAEVALEREKALKIKETADLAALELAREIQDYKDEKANNLREQITSERGGMATKEDLAGAVQRLESVIKPLLDFMAGQQSRKLGLVEGRTAAIAVAGVLVAALSVAIIVFTR